MTEELHLLLKERTLRMFHLENFILEAGKHGSKMIQMIDKGPLEDSDVIEIDNNAGHLQIPKILSIA